MIYIEKGNGNALTLSQSEILRYLGMGNRAPEPHLLNDVEAVTKEVIAVLAPVACVTVLDIFIHNSTVEFGAFSVTSNNLSKNLADCKKAALFCATIGTGVDRVIAKYAHVSPLKATIAQSVGTVAIEAWCDVLCDKILNKTGLFLRPRFSPGYGDFDLMYQKDLFRVLETSKKIGVALTDSFLMTPTKSVSAVVGLSDKNIQCIQHGCEVCKNRGACSYARG